MDDDESRIADKFEALRGVMDEQMRRLWAATEARDRREVWGRKLSDLDQ